MSRAPLTPAEIERIIELREKRLSEATIARLVGCSEKSVSWALLREGVDIHADKPLPPVPTEPIVQKRGGFTVRRFTQAEDERLAELAAGGLNVHQISRELGRRNNSVLGRMRSLARREARAEVQAGGH